MRLRSQERESHWRGVLDRQAESGLNIAAFCRQESISQPSFYAWRRKLHQREGGKPRSGIEGSVRRTGAPPEFVPVRIETASLRGVMRISWPDGVNLEVPTGADFSTVSVVVRALRETTLARESTSRC